MSREVVLLTQGTFDRGTTVDLLAATVTRDAASDRTFRSPRVEVLGGPPGKKADGVQSGAFVARGPDGTTEWDLTTPDWFETAGGPGDYVFSLDRVGTDQASPSCDRYCRNIFWGIASGWTTVESFDEWRNLPRFD